MADNRQIAADVLEAVGGKDNVSFVTHCMTRLRFDLKDKSAIDVARVKKIKGVIGAQEFGGQFQVIIGQNVPKVYNELCDMGGFAKQAAIDENLDATGPKEKLTPKKIGSNILNYLSGSMVQLIPLMMAGGLFRTFAVILGPDMLNLITTEDPTYVFFYTILYDATFYFLPIYLGYACAKKIGATPVLGMLMGGILISPQVVSLSADGGQISVYGLHITALNYTQTVLPIVLSVAALYFIEKIFKKIVPDTLSTIFTPFFTMIVSVPIAFIVLAPLGNEMGNLLGNGLFALGNLGGIWSYIAIAILGGFWQLIVITGMHTVILTIGMVQMLQVGSDTFVMVGAGLGTMAVWGVALGAFLRLKDKDEKGLALGYTIAAIVGGVTEPTLFGIIMRYRRTMLGMIAGGAVSSVLAMALGYTVYPAGGASNFLGLFGGIVGGSYNFVVTLACGLVSIVVATVVTFLVGFTKEELESGEPAEA